MIWGITDGSAGMRSQVEGVLQALGEPYEMKTCVRSKWFAWLPIALHRGALKQLDVPLTPPWPRAVVTSGRRSAAIALEIRRLSKGAVKLIHLTDPRSCRWKFDLIVAMAHDPAAGENVLKTELALHRITPEKLAAASKMFQLYPRPHVVALIGGSTNKYTLTHEAMSEVITRLKQVQSAGGSLLITPSRRTGAVNAGMLRNVNAAYLYDDEGENPYVSLLATADHIIVTDDSVNMLSEALATGKPVHVLNLPGHAGTKPAQFAKRMEALGYAKPLALPLQTWPYAAADEMPKVVAAIKRVLGT